MCCGRAAASQDPYQALPALSTPWGKHHICIVHVMMLEFLNSFCAGVTKQRNFTISVILFSRPVHENKLGAGLAVTFSCLCRIKFLFSRFDLPNKSGSTCRARFICFGDKRNHHLKLCKFEVWLIGVKCLDLRREGSGGSVKPCSARIRIGTYEFSARQVTTSLVMQQYRLVTHR